MIEPINKKLLLFEPEHAGHQMEYVLLFIKKAVLDPALTLTLVITVDLLQKLQRNPQWQQIEQKTCVTCLLFNAVEQQRCNHAALAMRSFWLWYTLHSYLKRTKANHVLSLRVDHFQLALALRLPLAASVVGILFQPSLHYAELGMNTRPSWRDLLRRWRQRVLYASMLQHSALHTLFSLDDTFASWGKEYFTGGEKIRYLPDPSHPEIIDYVDTPIFENLPKNRIVFLMFGALAYRKGIFVVLAALQRLTIEERKKLCVVFAGNVVASDYEAFIAQISVLQALDPQCFLHIEGFLPVEGIITLLRHCDVVLACYQRFVGSSGLLLWAASAQKPVLAQSYGLVGKWVREHRLGMAVDTTDAGVLARAFIDLLDNKLRSDCFDSDAVSNFAEEHHAKYFATTLLNAINTEVKEK